MTIQSRPSDTNMTVMLSPTFMSVSLMMDLQQLGSKYTYIRNFVIYINSTVNKSFKIIIYLL